MLRLTDFMNLILDFGEEWVVTKIEMNHRLKTIHINLEYKSNYYEDPITHNAAKLYDHCEVREWRHLDILDYKTYIRCRIPRVLCEDGTIKQISIGWADSYDRHTYQFETRVIDLLKITKNQSKTAEFLNCSFRMVNRIIHRSSERGLSRRDKRYLLFEHISIDEKSFHKGQNYVTVLSHPNSGAVIDVCENRDTESTKNLLYATFTEAQAKNICSVSMDMWKPYLKAINEVLPDAEIVHDRFHLVKYLNESMDKVRRRESVEEKILKDSRYALLKNEQNMTKAQKAKFKLIKESNLEVTKVWNIRENFKNIFGVNQNDSDAELLLINWATDSFMNGIKEVNKVILMFLSHMKGVVNAMISSYSNAMAERLNGKIQEVKLCSRGYRTFKNFRSAILFFHGGLDLYPHKW
jgi:transposase